MVHTCEVKGQGWHGGVVQPRHSGTVSTAEVTLGLTKDSVLTPAEMAEKEPPEPAAAATEKTPAETALGDSVMRRSAT